MLLGLIKKIKKAVIRGIMNGVGGGAARDCLDYNFQNGDSYEFNSIDNDPYEFNQCVPDDYIFQDDNNFVFQNGINYIYNGVK